MCKRRRRIKGFHMMVNELQQYLPCCTYTFYGRFLIHEGDVSYWIRVGYFCSLFGIKRWRKIQCRYIIIIWRKMFFHINARDLQNLFLFAYKVFLGWFVCCTECVCVFLCVFFYLQNYTKKIPCGRLVLATPRSTHKRRWGHCCGHTKKNLYTHGSHKTHFFRWNTKRLAGTNTGKVSGTSSAWSTQYFQCPNGCWYLIKNVLW